MAESPVDIGELVKNRRTPHRLRPLDFTTSGAAKSQGEFHQPAKVILQRRRANVIKMIMTNGQRDSGHKPFSAFHEDYGWKPKADGEVSPFRPQRKMKLSEGTESTETFNLSSLALSGSCPVVQSLGPCCNCWLTVREELLSLCRSRC